MNHHIERDEQSLRFSLESDATYIGVLGPRARYRQATNRPSGTGVRAGSVEGSTCAKPGGAVVGCRDTAGSGCVDLGRRSLRFAVVLKAAFSVGRSSASITRTTNGSWRARSRLAYQCPSEDQAETEDHGPIKVPPQHGPSAVLKLGELGEELPFKQVRRRHDFAVSDADDGRRVFAVRVEHRPILARHERLISEREHRGGAIVEMSDSRPEGTAHAGRRPVDA